MTFIEPSRRAAAPGNEDLRALNPLEQRRHKKAKQEFLIQQALQPEFEESEAQPEDIEDLAEAYRIRFEADTRDMTLEEVLNYFGVPEVSRVAIHKHLYPSKGSSNASQVRSKLKTLNLSHAERQEHSARHDLDLPRSCLWQACQPPDLLALKCVVKAVDDT